MSAKASRGKGEKRGTRSWRSDASAPGEEDWRRRLESLRRENEKLREQIAERDQQISEQQGQITDAEKQIADLERQLVAFRKNSTNSSKPPSSDGMASARRPRCSSREKSKRKPGGQPGHTGHNRPPVENPDRIEEVLPLACKHCGTALPQESAERQTVGDVFRRQILDLPPIILPEVTEYQYPKVVCPCCQKGTRAPLRPEHTSETGERLTAAISYLIRVRKMTRRDVQALLHDLFGVEISVGTVQKAWEETADAVAAPYADLAGPSRRTGVKQRRNRQPDQRR